MLKLILCAIILIVPFFVAIINANYKGDKEK